MFLDCLKHDKDLCVECAYVGMCDGQAADNCDLMNLAEFETTLNNRLAKLDDQFSAISDVLKAKKQAFTEMYRKDPRISHDEKVSSLQQKIEDFNPIYEQEIPALETVETIETASENKSTIYCESFSDDNKNVTISSCKRIIKGKAGKNGYCFLNHQKIGKNQILKWSLRVPKFKYQIGMVIYNNDQNNN